MRRLRCRGVAAIEAALVMVALAPVVALALYAGRLAVGGSALDRAASNAARYLATVPLESLRDGTRRAIALAVAQAMIEETLAAANVEGLQPVEFRCGSRSCSQLDVTEKPATVGVVATITYRDTLFGDHFPMTLTVHAEVGRGN